MQLEEPRRGSPSVERAARTHWIPQLLQVDTPHPHHDAQDHPHHDTDDQDHPHCDDQYVIDSDDYDNSENCVVHGPTKCYQKEGIDFVFIQIYMILHHEAHSYNLALQKYEG